MNTEKKTLPPYFCIHGSEQETNSELWKRYIDCGNSINCEMIQYDGDSKKMFYGINRKGMFRACYKASTFSPDCPQLTLEQWAEMVEVEPAHSDRIFQNDLGTWQYWYTDNEGKNQHSQQFSTRDEAVQHLELKEPQPKMIAIDDLIELVNGMYINTPTKPERQADTWNRAIAHVIHKLEIIKSK